MQIDDISTPEIYRESWDFRFFLKLFEECFTKVKYDTEHLIDIYDPLKCRRQLLWMLGDTIGWKYEDRLPASFNRLVLLYFGQMMRYKGSTSGVTFAAELNLAQFNLISYEVGYEDDDGNEVKGSAILGDRLEDTSIPVNSVYVTPHTAEGYIDVVYFSTKKPLDACIEYVRPLGMYVFQHSGVRFDARTQISIDARLTHILDLGESLGPTHVGHYTRNDYARGQEVNDAEGGTTRYKSDSVDMGDHSQAVQADIARTNDMSTESKVKVRQDGRNKRDYVWYRNSKHEVDKDKRINPGFHTLYSLELANNEHIVKSLIDPHFSLGFGPQKESDEYSDEKLYFTEDDVTVYNPKSYLATPYRDALYDNKDAFNLRYDRQQELDVTTDVNTLDDDALGFDKSTKTKLYDGVNPPMAELGDSIAEDDVIWVKAEDGKHRLRYLGKDEGEES